MEESVIMNKVNENRLGYKETKVGWVPQQWGNETLTNVIDIVSGMISPTEKPYNEYIHIGPENIISGTGQLKKLKIAKKEGLTSGKYLFDEKALVYSKIRPNLNKVCFPQFKGICSADAYPILSKDNLSPNYLLQYMLSDYFVKNATQRSMRTGLPKINREDLLSLHIPLPPLSEQKKIAEILSTWDQTIEKLEQLIELKEQRKKGLMQHLIELKCENWLHKRTDKIFKPISDKNYPSEELLSVTQNRGVIPRSMLEGKVMSPDGSIDGYKLIKEGDFVISLRSFQGGLEYSSYQGLISPAYTILRPQMEMDSNFYRHFFKSYIFINKYLAIAVVGIRDGKQISFKDFSSVKLPIPDLETQRRISMILNTADNEIKKLKQIVTTYKGQKKGLMQKLLTGEVRVKLSEGNR